MSIIVTVSSMIIPAIMLFIVGYGMIKKKNVYDDFVNGAKDGFKSYANANRTYGGSGSFERIRFYDGFRQCAWKVY